jgi:hypothetical protein
MKEKKSINVDDLNNPEDFYYFLENEPSLEEADGFLSELKFSLAEPFLISGLEKRQKALERLKGIEDTDNADDWYDISETLGEEMDQALSDLKHVLSYLAQGIEELSPEEAHQEKLKKIRKLFIRLRVDAIRISIATIPMCLYAYTLDPRYTALPIFIGAFIIFIQWISYLVKSDFILYGGRL